MLVHPFSNERFEMELCSVNLNWCILIELMTVQIVQTCPAIINSIHIGNWNKQPDEFSAKLTGRRRIRQNVLNHAHDNVSTSGFLDSMCPTSHKNTLL